MRKKNRRTKQIKVPLKWQIWAALVILLLTPGLFLGCYRLTGGTFPIGFSGPEGKNDPLFFGGLFTILLAIFCWSYLLRILQGVAQRRSATEIVADTARSFARDLFEIAIQIILSAFFGSSGSNNNSSSTKNNSGSGGKFGGGGASGGY
jgi:uncharacterized membrane protein YgcG